MTEQLSVHTHIHTETRSSAAPKNTPLPQRAQLLFLVEWWKTVFWPQRARNKGGLLCVLKMRNLREPHFSAQRTLSYYKVKVAWVGWSVENLNLVVVDLTRRWNSFIFLGLRTFSSYAVRCQKNSENSTNVNVSFLALIQLCKISTLKGKGNTTGNSQHYFYNFLRVYIMI